MGRSENHIFETAFRQAVEHHVHGRLPEALLAYDRILRSHPNEAAVHCNRGLVLQSLERSDAALQSYDRAIALAPGYADAHYNRALLLKAMNRLNDAIDGYGCAIRHNPRHVAAYSNRGNALRELGRLEEALRNIDSAIGLAPQVAESHYNRGTVLQELKHLDQALQSYDRAIALRPDFAEAFLNRGSVLRMLERPKQALQSCEKAIELRGEIADAWWGRGNALRDLGLFDEARRSYDRAIQLDPNSADAHWNKSLCLLLTGNLDEGLPLYEWRKKVFQAWRSLEHGWPPAWLGDESLGGKTLVVHAEQGLGDTIQFCRYVPLVPKPYAGIVLAVQDNLVRLLRGLGETVDVVGMSSPLPHFDRHIALLSMPFALRTDLQNCPADTPYLCPEPERVQHWRERLKSDDFKVGICWQGNPGNEADAGRSFPLRCFEGIAGIPGVRLISLQKNDGLEQLQKAPPGMRIESLEPDFDGGPDAFVDCAAVLKNLDLVITADTAVAHLAGALGCPVWVALKFVPDWRWFLDRSDSPWYPTMRLFRQTKPGDWPGVFGAIEREIRTRLAGR